MSPAPHRIVRAAPAKPLMLFDGNCHFCRRWIERWRDLTGDAVEYAPFQECAARFPEIPPEDFERAMHFIETDGTISKGAEAVFRSLDHNRRRRWMRWSYERVPGFAPIVALILLFVFYLSLTIAGQTFLSFQWDILLLEAGFLAIFFAPCRWRMSAARAAPLSRAGFFLLKLLLFKLMLMSGVVKL